MDSHPLTRRPWLLGLIAILGVASAVWVETMPVRATPGCEVTVTRQVVGYESANFESNNQFELATGANWAKYESQLRYTKVVIAPIGNTTAECSWEVPAGIERGHVLVVGGGGAGGTQLGGGGGGGGVFYGKVPVMNGLGVFVPGRTLQLSVGAGGVPAAADCSGAACNGGSGQPTTIAVGETVLISAGGGGGGGGSENAAPALSGTIHSAGGGGGGGAMRVTDGASLAGAAGGTALTGNSAFREFNGGLSGGAGGGGGSGVAQGSTGFSGGGGGAKGWAQSGLNPGEGAFGSIITFDRGATRYGAGGGGLERGAGNCGTPCFNHFSKPSKSPASGGAGSGGLSLPGGNGKDRTGGGGGGGASAAGGRGGTGVIVIAYPDPITVTGSAEISATYGTAAFSSAYSTTFGNPTLTSTWTVRPPTDPNNPPAGIRMTSGGQLQVQDDAPAGTHPVLVRASNELGSVGVLEVSVIVARASQPPLTFTSSAPSAATANDAGNVPSFQGGGGTGAYALIASDPSVCLPSQTEGTWPVSHLGPGTCSLELSRAGDDNYLDATAVTQSYEVGSAATTVPGTCEGASDAVFPRGDGSPGSPFIVTNSAQLEAMRLPACLSRHFVQSVDIAIPEGTPWDRIGIVGSPFTGSYEGGGYTILNVSISAAAPGVGFFGALSGATVSNVSLGNVSVTATPGQYAHLGRVGALAGSVLGSTVSGVTVTNAVVSTGGNGAGGMLGYVLADSGAEILVTDSYANASVSGSAGVGGLIGFLVSQAAGDVTVSASYSTGTVTGVQDIGGLIGHILRESTGAVTVENSYSVATANAGTIAAGGLIGGVNPYQAGGVTIGRSYSLGSVTAPNHKGGLIGYRYPSDPTRMVVTESFWDVTTSAQTSSVGGTGMSTEAMKTLQTFTDANWSIVSGSSGNAVWGQCQGQYPVLMWQFQRGVAPCPSSQNSQQNTPPPNSGTSLPGVGQGTAPGRPQGASPSAMVLPTRLLILALPEAVLVERSLVRGGETLVLNAGGFRVGEEFVVLIASDPQVVATVSADSDGRLIASFMVPGDLIFGDHSVVVWPMSGMGGLRQTITVQGATAELDRSLIGTPEVLPVTGGNYAVALWLGLVLIAIGMRCMRPRRPVLPSRTPVG